MKTQIEFLAKTKSKGDFKVTGTIRNFEYDGSCAAIFTVNAFDLETYCRLRIVSNTPCIEISVLKGQSSWEIAQRFGMSRDFQIRVEQEDYDRARQFEKDVESLSEQRKIEFAAKKEREIRSSRKIYWAIFVGGDTARTEIMEVYLQTEEECKGKWIDDVQGAHSFPNAKSYEIKDHKIFDLCNAQYAINLPNPARQSLAIGNLYGNCWLVSDEMAQAVIAAIENRQQEKNAERQAEQAERDAKFAKAKMIGQPVEIETWMDECNNPDEDCSFDNIILYAMPDGTTKQSRIHCY